MFGYAPQSSYYDLFTSFVFPLGLVIEHEQHGGDENNSHKTADDDVRGLRDLQTSLVESTTRLFQTRLQLQ